MYTFAPPTPLSTDRPREGHLAALSALHSHPRRQVAGGRNVRPAGGRHVLEPGPDQEPGPRRRRQRLRGRLLLRLLSVHKLGRILAK